MASTLMGLLAGLAVVLAAVGIYGVISYSVSERKREIGIRIAVGADGPIIFRLVVGRVMSFVLGGIVVGIVGALALLSLLQATLTLPDSFEQELERQCRLAGARIALDQKQMIPGITAGHDVIQSGHSGEKKLGRRALRGRGDRGSLSGHGWQS